MVWLAGGGAHALGAVAATDCGCTRPHRPGRSARSGALTRSVGVRKAVRRLEGREGRSEARPERRNPRPALTPIEGS